MPLVRDIVNASGFVETTDATWTRLLDFALVAGLDGSAATCSINVVVRQPSTGNSAHWLEACGLNRDAAGVHDVGSAMRSVVNKLSKGSTLTGANIRIVTDGAFIYLEVLGLVGETLQWAGSVSGDVVYSE